MNKNINPKQFSGEFLNSFYSQLRAIFKTDIDSETIPCLTSTCGWDNAFRTTCELFDMMDVYSEYDSLEWYELDEYCDNVGEQLTDFLKHNNEIRV